MIWGHAAMTTTNIEKLRKLNRIAANTITAVRKSNPSRALEIIYDLMPLHLATQKAGMASYIRNNENLDNKQTKASPLYKMKSHVLRWKRLSVEADISTKDLDSINMTYREKYFNINLNSFTGSHKHLRRSEYNVYTDGSKLDGKCGTGFAIYKGRKLVSCGKAKLPEAATVFQAEINGIKLACDKIQEEVKKFKPKYIKIFSDSQAALLALNSFFPVP